MIFDDFIATCRQIWTQRLSQISEMITAANYTIESGLTPLFPTTMLVAEVGHQYLMELIGAAERFGGLQVKKLGRIRSTTEFFGGIQGNPCPAWLGKPQGQPVGDVFLGDMIIIPRGSRDELQRRYPGMLVTEPFVVELDGQIRNGNIIDIGPSDSYVRFERCTFVYDRSGHIRARNVAESLVIERGGSVDDLRKYYSAKLDLRAGLSLMSPERSAYAIRAAQLVALYMTAGVSELTVGEFLRDHDDVLRTALGGSQVLYEPEFKWQPGTPSRGDTAINPDFMLQSTTGRWIIGDLKLALPSVARLTKGQHSRRRFTDKVAEGIAQLANYEAYFTHEANRAYVKATSGISVVGPSKLLIVGNSENLTRAEADEALRSSPGTEVLDYDSLVALYLAARGAWIPRLISR